MKRSENQARLYVGAFFAAWTFPTIFQLVLVISGDIYYPLLLLTAVFVPIQGFLNMLVYMRGTYHKYRKANQSSFFFVVWGKMLWSTLKDKTHNESLEGSTTVVERLPHQNTLNTGSFTGASDGADDNIHP
jgi:hypothetical protein